jgi:hypothetical protein
VWLRRNVQASRRLEVQLSQFFSSATVPPLGSKVCVRVGEEAPLHREGGISCVAVGCLRLVCAPDDCWILVPKGCGWPVVEPQPHYRATAARSQPEQASRNIA